MSASLRGPASPVQAGCLFAVAALLVVHVAIGSAWYLMLVLAAIALIGAGSLRLERLTFSTAYVFALSVYSGLGPLALKALLWQPLESNLVEPGQTALLLAAAFASAAWASQCSTRSAPAQHTGFALGGSQRLVVPLTLAGFVFQALHIVLRPELANDSLGQTEGFGGFGSLYFLLLLAAALQFYWYARTGSERYLRLILVTGAAFLLLSLLGNVKKVIFDFLVVAALSVVAYDLRIRWARCLAAAAVLGVLLAYLSPAIHLTRDSFQGSPLLDRLAGTYEVLAKHRFSLSELHEAESEYFRGFSYNYRPNASYVFPSTMNVDRFCLLFPLDQVVRAYDEDGRIGLAPFVSHAVTTALPSLLVSKDAFSGADLVAWQYGIRDLGSIARPVIGLAASAVAAGGSWGALLLPALVLLPIFFVLDRFPGRLAGSPLAVMLIALSSQMAEKEIDGLLIFFLRQVPVALIVSVLLLRWGVAPASASAPAPALDAAAGGAGGAR